LIFDYFDFDYIDSTSYHIMEDLDQYIGQMISGKQLNELLDGMPLLKFMNDSEIHHGMKYQDGDNLDILPFNDSGECSPGGIYITELKNYYIYCNHYGNICRRVRVTDTALVYVEKDKLKCDEIYLEPRMPKNDLLRTLIMEYMQHLVDGSMF